MRKAPSISVIVPVYNCGEFIIECIESILNQTYQNFELIIINDGSDDNSGKRLRTLCSSFPKIKYIEKCNEGVSKTRNLGLSLSTGDFITFIDGDDYVSNKFFEEALAIVEKYDLDFVLGGTQKFSNNLKQNYAVNCGKEPIIYEYQGIKTLEKKFLSNGFVEDRRLDRCFTSGPVCKLFRRSLVSGIRFNTELITGEDTVFNLDAIRKSKRVGIVSSIWYYYRINEKSITNNFNPKIREHYEKTLNYLLDVYEDNKEMMPYLRVRATQQLHGVILLYPLHSKSKMTYLERRKYIINMLRSEPWSIVFDGKYKSRVPVNGIDKLLYKAAQLKVVDLMIFFVKLRLIMKKY